MGAELDVVIEMLSAVGLNRAEMSIHERRDLLAASVPDLTPAGATVEELVVAGRPAEMVTAEEVDGSTLIVWLHGGAFTAGGLRSHRGFAAALSRRSAASVLLLDYRLAPEHPFPAALEDASAALDWAFDHGPGPQATLLGGDSAGGGLALSTLMKARDEGRTLPAGAITLSPWVDLAMVQPSYDTEALADPMCSREALEPSAAAYLGAHDRRDPACSPLYGDFAGLPPLLLHVGSREVLRDESIALVAAAEAAGVEVTSWVAPGMIHVWHLFSGSVPESDAALEIVGTWAADHLAG